MADKKQLFISASGALSSMPFGILVSEMPAGPNGATQTLRGAKWFADSHVISVIPSLQSLQFIRQFRAGDGGENAASYLGFGNPVLAGTGQSRGARGTRGSRIMRGGADPSFDAVYVKDIAREGNVNDTVLANVDDLRKLASLPGTGTEINAQWKAFGSPAHSVFTQSDATETAFKTTRLNASVISLATHGLLAGEIRSAAEPGLVFTPPATATMEDDGYLTASEILTLNITADWVLLSACNTASGDGNSGAPGLSGLARSFFYAGATNLLVSHWPVRDDTAAQLTVRAIEIKRTNPQLSRAEALQQSMREIRNDKRYDGTENNWAHPSAWAPFSFVGDGAR